MGTGLVGFVVGVACASVQSVACKAAEVPEAATMNSDKRSSGRVEKVPGGWRLKGDVRVYPFNPLVPADKENPFPEKPKPPPTKSTPNK